MSTDKDNSEIKKSGSILDDPVVASLFAPEVAQKKEPEPAGGEPSAQDDKGKEEALQGSQKDPEGDPQDSEHTGANASGEQDPKSKDLQVPDVGEKEHGQKSEEPTPPDKSDVKVTDEALLENPLTDYSADEIKTLHGKTRKRIETLCSRWKDAEERAVQGKQFLDIIEKHELQKQIPYVTPDNLADAMTAFAAVNRAHLAIESRRRPAEHDLQIIAKWAEIAKKTAVAFGVEPLEDAPAPQKKEPEADTLPEKFQDMIDILGWPEEDVRALYASTRKKSPEDARKRPVSKNLMDSLPPSAPEGVDEVAIYHQRLLQELAHATQQTPEMAEAYRLSLSPRVLSLIRAAYPTATDESLARNIYKSLPPEQQYKLFIRAHKGEGAVAIPQKKTPVLSPATRSSPNGAPAKKPAPAPDELDQLLARMFTPTA